MFSKVAGGLSGGGKIRLGLEEAACERTWRIATRFRSRSLRSRGGHEDCQAWNAALRIVEEDERSPGRGHGAAPQETHHYEDHA